MDCLTTAKQSTIDAVPRWERPPGRWKNIVEMLRNQPIGCKIRFNRKEMIVFFSKDRESRTPFFKVLDHLGMNLRYTSPYARGLFTATTTIPLPAQAMLKSGVHDIFLRQIDFIHY